MATCGKCVTGLVQWDGEEYRCVNCGWRPVSSAAQPTRCNTEFNAASLAGFLGLSRVYTQRVVLDDGYVLVDGRWRRRSQTDPIRDEIEEEALPGIWNEQTQKHRTCCHSLAWIRDGLLPAADGRRTPKKRSLANLIRMTDPSSGGVS